MSMSDEVEERRSPWRRARILARTAFGRGFWVYLGVAAASALACYLVKGDAALDRALDHNIEYLAQTLPRVFLAVFVAGLVWVLMPRDLVSRHLGENSGARGLFIAAGAGAVTPGGPAAAFSLLAVLGGAGADRGAMVAYAIGWATLGIQRILVWELPFLGTDFTVTRFLIGLPMPIIAGLIARRLADPLGGAIGDAASTRKD